jgi:hypothetical protein
MAPAHGGASSVRTRRVTWAFRRSSQCTISLARTRSERVRLGPLRSAAESIMDATKFSGFVVDTGAYRSRYIYRNHRAGTVACLAAPARVPRFAVTAVVDRWRHHRSGREILRRASGAAIFVCPVRTTIIDQVKSTAFFNRAPFSPSPSWSHGGHLRTHSHAYCRSLFPCMHAVDRTGPTLPNTNTWRRSSERKRYYCST